MAAERGFELTLDEYSFEAVESYRRTLVPDLEFEQAVYEGSAGRRITLTTSKLPEPIETQSAVQSVDSTYALGYISEGSSYAEVSASGDEAELLVREAIDKLALEDLDQVVESPSAFVFDGYSLIDQRSNHIGADAVDTQETRYSTTSGQVATVSWSLVTDGLSLEVLSTPLERVMVIGDRTVAVVSAVAGEPARATWIEAGLAVSVSGGRTISDVSEIVENVEFSEELVLPDVPQGLRALPVLATWSPPGMEAEFELGSDGGRSAVCTSEECSELDLFGVGAVLSVNGSSVVVGAYPSGGDSALITLDGEELEQVVIGEHSWFAQVLDADEPNKLSMQVAEIVMDPVQLELD